MGEYITKNNAISAVCFGCNQEFSDEPCEPDACAIRQSIMALPIAGVEEVIRCKDCVHNADNGGNCDRVLIHTHRNLITETNEYQYFKLNFCEYGTPKERGEEE